MEATAEQLSALHFRVASGAPPFVDFGVWRPHGTRFSRIMRFQAVIPLPDGAYQHREFAGPAAFSEWAKGWEVLQFAM